MNRSRLMSVALKAIILLILIGAVIAAVIISSRKTEPESLNQGAVVTNGIECAAIGRSIMERGGSVADVAVTTLICEGITCPQSSGLGGGFLLTIYIKSEGIIETLNAREVAPKLANSTMYVDNPNAAYRGGLAVAVPGELKGLWELHQKYGKMNWSDLIQPNIELCRKGHVVSPYLRNIFESREKELLNEPTLREIYINPETNKTYGLGELIKRPKLAESLEIIAKEGADAIYGGGSLMQPLLDDIEKFNGIIKEDDLRDYRVRWNSPHNSTLPDGSTLHTVPLPSTGSVLAYMMNILSGYQLEHDALSYHRITEAFKFAYAKRTFLGDEQSNAIKEMVYLLTSANYAKFTRGIINDNKTFHDFEYYGAKYVNPEDHGTAHISILSPNGDAIAATSTINYLLGAFIRSQSTGIILNDEMDDFSTPGFVNQYGIPASPANFIQPGKNPLSSMVPTIIIGEDRNVKLIIGGAGGTRITSGVAFTIIRHLFMNESLNDAIVARRLHHQLAPMKLQYETNFDADIIQELGERFGHELLENTPDGGFAAVVGISQRNGIVEGVIDPRRGGGVEIFSQ